jgi:DNA topoisomerase I
MGARVSSSLRVWQEAGSGVGSTADALGLVHDSQEAAKAAGLRYSLDSVPGLARRRVGRGFSYVAPGGRRVRDAATLKRIRSLAIPPAWRDVWISIHPSVHLQATGRDAKGRKQYRYHPRWRATRDETKFHRMIAFAAALPRLRARVERDLRRPGLPRERVLATVVRLLETTLIRVGNEEYAHANGSYGLTTLRDRHVAVRGETVAFRFRGKSGVAREVDLHDRRLASIVRKCQDLPGHELFQYVTEDGQTVVVESGDVNEYVRATTGAEFSAKDFRTWGGTVLAAAALGCLDPFESVAQARKNVVEVVRRVSRRLGNTPSVCRKCYIHPAVLDGYLQGQRVILRQHRNQAGPGGGTSSDRLRSEERAVVLLLESLTE